MEEKWGHRQNSVSREVNIYMAHTFILILNKKSKWCLTHKQFPCLTEAQPYILMCQGKKTEFYNPWNWSRNSSSHFCLPFFPIYGDTLQQPSLCSSVFQAIKERERKREREREREEKRVEETKSFIGYNVAGIVAPFSTYTYCCATEFQSLSCNIRESVLAQTAAIFYLPSQVDSWQMWRAITFFTSHKNGT